MIFVKSWNQRNICLLERDEDAEPKYRGYLRGDERYLSEFYSELDIKENQLLRFCRFNAWYLAMCDLYEWDSELNILWFDCGFLFGSLWDLYFRPVCGK